MPQRGRVYVAPLGAAGEKLWLCVSNNARNTRLDEFLAVRLTTSAKPTMPSVVPLTAADQPLVGSVVCDDLGPIYLDEVIREGGAVSPATMRRVDEGLKYVLSLR